MKKTVLTIALFSLIAVSTSFASVDNSGIITKSQLSVDPTKQGSGSTGNVGGRKIDFQNVENQTVAGSNVNFGDVNQSQGRNYKVD